MRRPGVEERERPADDLVLEAGEPAGLSRRDPVEVPSDHLDEHQLGEPGDDGVRARPAEPGLLGELAREAAEPGGRQAAHVHSPRQRGEERIERAEVAAEIAADEGRRPRGARAQEHDVGEALLGRGIEVGRRPCAPVAHHDVRVAVGEDDRITGRQLDELLPDQAAEAAAREEDVVRDQVLGPGQDPGGQLAGRRARHGPRLRRLDRIEVGAVEPDDPEQVGEGVHGSGILPPGYHGARRRAAAGPPCRPRFRPVH